LPKKTLKKRSSVKRVVAYNHARTEKKWQKKWASSGIYEPNLKTAKNPFYNLMMFPYPSAEGLHVGNMYAFTGADVYGRFKRMQGYDVFEPIGLDGFGIHSENYALKVGTHPITQAKISEKRFYKQLEMIGNGFAWKERLETYDPDYYRWTQWLFTVMFKKGLAYRKKAVVNWCPSCKTVLADEQVIAGECERCDTIVIKKELEQWFFKITKYAERLLSGIDTIDWSEKVKIAQKNWIGKSEGALIQFPISHSQLSIEVYTTRADTIFGATFLVIGPEHPLLMNNELDINNEEEVKEYIKVAKKKSEEDRMRDKVEKTGVELEGVRAINPATKEPIPVWVADYVLGHVGTGAIMAVPAHDTRDFAFAKKYWLNIVPVVEPDAHADTADDMAVRLRKSIVDDDEAYVGHGRLVNSGPYDGMDSLEARTKIIKAVEGKKKITYRLRDWLISRQRYWGPPIPMIFCVSCKEKGAGERKDMPGWYTVPNNDLPVMLPNIKNFRPTGNDTSPLASVKSFYEVVCPKCKKMARRETDVSDTFLDSAWYYMRYPSQTEKKRPWHEGITKKWFPVDMYIGGAEHAVLHLLYVRFFAMALYDGGMITFEEPFQKFRAHGLLIKGGSKMSKSKGNVVNPDDYIKKCGADALRMYLMFLGPFAEGGDFQDTGILGITRFLERIWRLSHNVHSGKKSVFEKDTHAAIKKVTDDIANLRYNTAISACMILLNAFEAGKNNVTASDVKILLKLTAPFAPHMTEELWHMLGEKKSIHVATWPAYDEKYLMEETYNLVVQVNGRVRATIEMPRGSTREEAEILVRQEKRVMGFLDAGTIRKVIFVPDKLINFVL